MQEIKPLSVKRVAVLGAGVMGAQIAAHFVNANIETIVFDLAADGAHPNATVEKSIAQLAKLKPAPLATPDRISALQAANYDDDLARLGTCDLVIEAIAERQDLKESLYQKIQPFLSPEAMLVTNTSGLSVNALANTLTPAQRPRFCGIHFFNPPRYMRLVEIIPSEASDRHRLAALEAFFVSTLGKGIVYAKDTPNFIANRIGVFSLLSTFHHAQAFNIPFDVVDALTGPLIGRPKSATFRTADVVGLDTLAHVIETMTTHLTDDPWHAYFQLPTWLSRLIDDGRLGQKTRAGIYRKDKEGIHVLDPETGQYRLADQKPDGDVIALLKTPDLKARFAALQKHPHPQAQFLMACFRDLFHYTAVHLPTIADSMADVDEALCWGFGWKQGPFTLWRKAGWSTIQSAISEAIETDQAMAAAPLPAWAADEAQATKQFGQTRSMTGVYRRQIVPKGKTLFSNDVVELWHDEDEIAVLSFKTKFNTISDQVLDAIIESVGIAERDHRGLVLWHRYGDHFSAGANLKEFIDAITKDKLDIIERAVNKFQQASQALRYAQVPTIAALKGYVFGGGCEIALHCTRRVSALETYMGLVEAGVGLLPAGGGCKALALAAAQRTRPAERVNQLQDYFLQVAQAQVSTSALHARQMGYLQDADPVIFNPDELLFVAKQQATALFESNYRPPLPSTFPVVGKTGIANFQAAIVNFQAGDFISEHDATIATHIATVLCGGELDEGTVVDEAWFLRLEREGFVALAGMEKTKARIQYTLQNGKPLRN